MIFRISAESGATMFDCKKDLILKFCYRSRSKITDFVTCNEIPNVFSKENENRNAFYVLHQLQENRILIYFTVVQHKLKIKVYSDPTNSKIIYVPLSFQNKTNTIFQHISDTFKTDIQISSLFVDNESLDDIEELQQAVNNFDIKDLYRQTIIAYLYPIDIVIHYQDNVMNYKCKSLTELVGDVINKTIIFLSLPHETNDVFCFQESTNILNGSMPIHQYLYDNCRNKRDGQIMIKLIRKQILKPFSITVSNLFQETDFKFLIPEVQKLSFGQIIKQHFEIDDNIGLRNEEGDLIDLSSHPSSTLEGKKLVLVHQDPLIQIQRKFEIEGKIIVLSLLVNSTIQQVLNILSSVTKYDNERLSLQYSNIKFKPDELFASYYIDPSTPITVNVSKIEQYSIFVNKYSKATSKPKTIEIKIPTKSSIGEIKKLAHTSKKAVMLYGQVKLDENELFANIKRQIRINPNIDVYESELFAFEYQDSVQYIVKKEAGPSFYSTLKSLFYIPDKESIFLVRENTLIPDDVCFNRYEVGSLFHIKCQKTLTLTTKIHKKNSAVEVKNTDKGQSLYTAIKCDLDADLQFKLFSPRYKEIQPNEYLFNYFPDEGTTFTIFTNILIQISVLMDSNSRFIQLLILPTSTPAQIKRQLKEIKTGIRPLFLTFYGKILDDNTPLNDQVPLPDYRDFDDPFCVYCNAISTIYS